MKNINKKIQAIKNLSDKAFTDNFTGAKLSLIIKRNGLNEYTASFEKDSCSTSLKLSHWICSTKADAINYLHFLENV